MIRRAAVSAISAAVALILAAAAEPAAAHDDHRKCGDERHEQRAERIALTSISTFDAGGAGSAEIVAYDAKSRRLFVVTKA